MADRSFYESRAPFRSCELKSYYHKLLHNYFAFFVPPGVRVLELGCGLGDLLAAVKPSRGVGVDLSPAMVEQARQRHPDLEFHVSDAAEFNTEEKFDYILISDTVNDFQDVQT